MRKIVFLLLTCSICLLLMGCDIFFQINEHSCIYSDWETVEEATCLAQGEEERYCIICYDVESRAIDKTDHTSVDVKEKSPTCTQEGSTKGSYCSECLIILSGIEKISPTGHTEVIDPAIDATDDAPGRTEGKHCSTCGEVLVKQMSIFSGDYSNPEKYHGDYAYESLAALANGVGMRSFYEEIDEIASDFHMSLNDAKSKESAGKNVYYVAEIVFSDNGINKEEALSAWCAYTKDHPLYYWMSSLATYTDEYITLIVDDRYYDGEVREEINLNIYNTVKEYVTALDGEGDIYQITLAFHDRIIQNADYAYESDGVTPSTEVEAHNITGVLLEGAGVCESYSKSFQLLLNYCGVENIYVTGYAGEPHAWNLVKLDDDQWYWYDLTWDDQPNWMLGVRHNYFCVNDSDFVDWKDGGSSGTSTFLHDHTPQAPGGVSVNYSYQLPARATESYDYDGLMMRDEVIIKDGIHYVLIGFRSLSLIKIEAEGEIVIPESIVFNGTELSVDCIGKYDSENKVLLSGSVIEYDSATRDHLDVTAITIPKTVRFIWDYAFDHCYTIEEFIVSNDNPKFTSQNGVLFTKSLYTLIKYPLAASVTSYTVPTATKEIAYGAFGDGGNVFAPKSLKSLTIGTNVEVIGAGNFGRGYRDATPKSQSDIVMISGYEDRLTRIFGSGLKIQ